MRRRLIPKWNIDELCAEEPEVSSEIVGNPFVPVDGRGGDELPDRFKYTREYADGTLRIAKKF